MPTKEQIEQILTELQGVMRIQDWDVSIEIVNDREMDSIAKCEYIPGGYCYRNRHYKTAAISLNKDYEDYEKDWYSILIHELYHVVLEDMDNFWDNEVFRLLPEDKQGSIGEKHTFYIERLNCDLTRQFCGLHPLSHKIASELKTEGMAGLTSIMKGESA